MANKRVGHTFASMRNLFRQSTPDSKATEKPVAPAPDSVRSTEQLVTAQAAEPQVPAVEATPPSTPDSATAEPVDLEAETSKPEEVAMVTEPQVPVAAAPPEAEPPPAAQPPEDVHTASEGEEEEEEFGELAEDELEEDTEEEEEERAAPPRRQAPPPQRSLRAGAAAAMPSATPAHPSRPAITPPVPNAGARPTPPPLPRTPQHVVVDFRETANMVAFVGSKVTQASERDFVHLGGEGVDLMHFSVLRCGIDDYRLTPYAPMKMGSAMVKSQINIGRRTELVAGKTTFILEIEDEYPPMVFTTGDQDVQPDAETRAITTVDPPPPVPAEAIQTLQRGAAQLRAQGNPMDAHPDPFAAPAPPAQNPQTPAANPTTNTPQNAGAQTPANETEEERKKSAARKAAEKAAELALKKYKEDPKRWTGWIVAAVLLVILIAHISMSGGKKKDEKSATASNATATTATVAATTPPAPPPATTTAPVLAAKPTTTPEPVNETAPGASTAASTEPAGVVITPPKKLDACVKLDADAAKEYLGLEDFDAAHLDTMKADVKGVELCCSKNPQANGEHELDVSNADCSLCPTGQCTAS